MSQREVIQKYFNIVVEGLRKQGWKQCLVEHRSACGTNTSCVWSNDVPGLHCAIGHIVPKERHAEVPFRLQNNWTAYKESLYPEDLLEEMRKTADVQLNYLSKWQQIHDGKEVPEEMEKRFREFAKENDLSWPEEQS
jgi:hypothetical protein